MQPALENTNGTGAGPEWPWLHAIEELDSRRNWLDQFVSWILPHRARFERRARGALKALANEIAAERHARIQENQRLAAELRHTTKSLEAVQAELDSASRLALGFQAAISANATRIDELSALHLAHREEDNRNLLRIGRLAELNRLDVAALQRLASKYGIRIDATEAGVRQLNADVRSNLSALNASLDGIKTQVESTVARIRQEADQALAQAKTELDAVREQSRNDVHRLATSVERVASTAAELNATLHRVQAESQTELARFKSEIESNVELRRGEISRIAESQAELIGFKSAIEAKLEQRRTEASELSAALQRVKTESQAELSRFRAEIEPSIEQRRGEISRVAEHADQLASQLAASLKQLTSDLDRMRSDSLQRVTAAETLAKATLHRVEQKAAKADEALARAQEQSRVDLESLRAKVLNSGDRLKVVAERLEQVGRAPFYFENAKAAEQFERFYLAFENRYRGSREEILRRQKAYLPKVENAPALAGLSRADFRIVDLGCGRGEWLQLLRDSGFTAAIGVDTNPRMLESAKELGLPTEQTDAMEFLRRQPDRSLGAVSAFHLVEHVSFPTLLSLMAEAKRALLPGGVLILETPNCENVITATQSFRNDPTHRFILPPRLLSFAVEFAGFTDITPLRLQPYATEHQIDGQSAVAKRFNEFFFGPQDFGLVARNP